MDESNLGQSAPESSVSEASSHVAETPSERSLPQSQVNELIGRAKHEAVEAYKRQSSQASHEPRYSQSSAPVQQTNYQGMSENELRRIASEEIQRSRDQWVTEAQSRSEQENAQRIVQNFWDKIASGKEKYEDFEKITGDIEYARFPNVVQLLADHIDNSDDVLYELGKDRLKMAQLEQLSQMSPRDAVVQAKRMAESIKNNQAASRIRTPNAPLSQQRPSNTGTDSGPLTMRDLKARYRG